MRHGTQWSLLICFASLVMGCGADRPETYPVRGKVLFSDGTPVRSGVVELLSAEFGETATGRIEPDGSFVLGTFREDDGACSGRHGAIVVQMIITDSVTTHQRDHGDPVDPRFGSYETSGLEVDIQPVELNEITLTVERRPRR